MATIPATTRLSAPAISTATFGRNAPVAMDVAIALAVSWNPLVKSKANAVTTTTTTMIEKCTSASTFRARNPHTDAMGRRTTAREHATKKCDELRTTFL